MHNVIRLVTHGENRDQAHEQAKGFADELVERGEFDYWVETGKTYRLTSQLGQMAVEGAMKATRREFDDALRAAHMMIQDFTSDQIYNDDYPVQPEQYWPSRFQFTQVGGYHFYLYGDHETWGGAVRNDKDYAKMVEGHEDQLWVTSFDMHS